MEPTEADLEQLVDIEHELQEEEIVVDNEPDLEDSMRLYLREIGRVPLMSPEKVVECARAAIKEADRKGCRPSETEPGQRIVKANLRLVVAIMKRFGGPRYIDRLDVIQEGNVTLLYAVDRFDPDKGFMFSTYAAWWIKQGVVRALNANARMISIPAHQRERERQVNLVFNRFIQNNGYEPSMSEMEQEMWLYLLERYTDEFIRTFFKQNKRVPSVEERDEQLKLDQDTLVEFAKARNIPLKQDDIRDARNLPGTVRLETTIDNDGTELGDTIASPEQPAPQYDQSDVDTILAPLVQRHENGDFVYPKGPMQAKILHVRAGIDRQQAMKLQDTGRELGLTRERARQLEEEARKIILQFSNNPKIRDIRGED